MIEFIEKNKEIALLLTILSALFFLLSVSIIPFFLVRIPFDYFVKKKKNIYKCGQRPGPLKIFGLILKNLFGLILFFCGIAMLFLPGQGILTILLSIVLIDFPGKYKLQLWLVSRPAVLKAVNKMRKRAHQQPLII